MDGGDKRELARKMAAAKAQQASAGRRSLGGGGANQAAKGNSLSFFGGDADGWQMSPKTILLFSVAYMGVVIMLHILSKITHLKSSSPDANPSEDAGADL